MAPITMKPEEITSHLTHVLKRLADTIGWVSEQRKAITFDVPDNVGTGPRDGGCLLPLKEAGRIDVEILLGVSKIMHSKRRK